MFGETVLGQGSLIHMKGEVDAAVVAEKYKVKVLIKRVSSLINALNVPADNGKPSAAARDKHSSSAEKDYLRKMLSRRQLLSGVNCFSPPHREF